MSHERVGGYTKIVEATPAVEATPDYSAGDLLGGKIIFANAVRGSGHHSGVVQSVVITDLAKQSINIDVLLFDTEPTNTTFTENGAFDVDDTDILNLVGVALVSDWKAFNDNSMGQALNLGIPFDLGTGTTLWAVMVSRGTINLGATSDITLRVGILQD
ncbi:hypothetical protein LCGC14_0355240 [marine sediment metagenome]|uniref:Uncharacterized protein n=1 Tax=marine sediment metagenome TaxID=412755 RepID=A0A0F9TFB4_9ZZZZ